MNTGNDMHRFLPLASLFIAMTGCLYTYDDDTPRACSDGTPECVEGYVCVGGVCVTGADAGAVDAGQGDAGARIALEQCQIDGGVDHEWALWPLPPYAPPDSQYRGNAGGWVLDTATGLYWERTPPTAQQTAASARKRCTALTLGGVSGWRVPSLIELATLLDFGIDFNDSNGLLVINGHIFPRTTSQTFWASIDDRDQPYAVGFQAPGAYPTSPESQAATRCVLSACPQAAVPDFSGIPAGRFVADAGVPAQSGDPTIYDTATTLTWQASVTSLSAGLDLSTVCQAKVGDGWRAPDPRELLSLINTRRGGPVASPLFRLLFSSSNTGSSGGQLAVDLTFGSLYASNQAQGSLTVHCVHAAGSAAGTASDGGVDAGAPTTIALGSCPVDGGVDHEWTQGPLAARAPPDSQYLISTAWVYDKLTGLYWQRYANFAADFYARQQTYCSKLRLGGQAGWRLPTYVELASLADFSVPYVAPGPTAQPRPCLNQAAFPEQVTNQLWSTQNARVYSVGFSPFAAYAVFNPDSTGLGVRCVLSACPQALVDPDAGVPAGRFVIDGGAPTSDGGTIYDTVTGLTWQRDQVTNSAAISITEVCPLSFGAGWRLPNPRELISISNVRKAAVIDPLFGEASFQTVTSVFDAGVYLVFNNDGALYSAYPVPASVRCVSGAGD